MPCLCGNKASAHDGMTHVWVKEWPKMKTKHRTIGTYTQQRRAVMRRAKANRNRGMSPQAAMKKAWKDSR